ncbi:unnamed protein product [Gordionus sp. m RMFG-2023]
MTAFNFRRPHPHTTFDPKYGAGLLLKCGDFSFEINEILESLITEYLLELRRYVIKCHDNHVRIRVHRMNNV